MDSDSQHGGRQLTQGYLRELFKKEWKLYYRTPELNEKLYLHYKGKLSISNHSTLGFTKIQNLEQFTDLKCLYFEGNGMFLIHFNQM